MSRQLFKRQNACAATASHGPGSRRVMRKIVSFSMDEELEIFKRIRLHEYAAELGYEVDRDESSKREIVMRKAGDKIAIRLDTDGHYVYYSFRNQADNGTIIDFIKGRQGKNLGEVRKALRVFQGKAAIAVYEPLEAAPRFDRNGVLTECRAMKTLAVASLAGRRPQNSPLGAAGTAF